MPRMRSTYMLNGPHTKDEIVSSVEKQKAKMRKHLEQLDDLFASLQQRAFRGDL